MNQVNIFQRIEGACLLLISIFFYLHLNLNIWAFILLLLSIDVFMIGYIKNNKAGAYVYNFGHSIIMPSALIVFGTLWGNNATLALGLIWLAHIGMDRMLGYGLKLETGFKHTHLGTIGAGTHGKEK